MTEREMSFGAALSSSPGSLFSPVEWTIERAACTQVTLQDAAAQLPGAFADLRTQLLHTHEGMRQLFVKCDAVGQCVQRCTDALLRLETSPTGSFAAASDRASSGSAAAIGTSQRQLCWSLAQYHTHVARLLSADNVRAYDTAVSDKIANRLKLLERGAATLQRCVAGVGAAQRPGEKVGGGSGVVWGSAQQLEQLARTRFAPAYEGFLLYAVATLGDFCDVWDTAAQRSAEEGVVYTLGATSLPSEKVAANLVGGCVGAAPSDPYKARPRAPPAHLSSCFREAINGVEGLRQDFMAYVRLLHANAADFSAAAVALRCTFHCFNLECGEGAAAEGVTQHVERAEGLLDVEHYRWQTRRQCYEALLQERVLSPLRSLQKRAEACGKSRRVPLEKQYHSGDTPTQGVSVKRRAAQLWGRMDQCRSSDTEEKASCPNESLAAEVGVLHDAWFDLVNVFVHLGHEAGNEVGKEVKV